MISVKIWLGFFFIFLTGQLFCFEETGIASWYGGKFQGRKTANGEIFDTYKLTAAHKTLPFDSLITVRNETNGKEVIVRINDRGPFIEGRIIDLSYEAARQIDMINSGTARVKLISQDPSLEEIIQTGPLDFTIQVGSFSLIENALAMKKKLMEAGFAAQAELSNQGTTRILIKNISQDKCYEVVKSLEAMGFKGMQIKQN
jgi:rare lipoprotein A